MAHESGETLDAEEQIKQATTRKKKKRGCLIFTFILLLGPGILIYEMQFKEILLTSSVSPNGEHKIKVVEKGSALTFGPSKVRIKSGWRFTNRYIANDGGRLYPSNASIEWKSNDVALITLSGEEQ